VTLQRPPGRPVARSVTVAGLALAGLLLSGCGGSLGIHPGSAAVIGDDTLSMDKIDSTATLYCRAYLPQLQQAGQKVPMHYLRQFVATSLAERDLGQQLADQYAVQPTSQYQTRLNQVAQQFASAAPDVKQAVLDVEGGDPYLQTIQVAIGQKLLTEAGTPTTQAKAALQRGQVATQDWLRTHSASIDPVFGVAVDGGAFDAVQDQTSYPLSALASSGAVTTGQPDPTYTAALTPGQLCG
jgi:peptidyl-prolyl cis-trans isomerase SurA